MCNPKAQTWLAFLFLLTSCSGVINAQNISVDFESAAIGDAARTVSGVNFANSQGSFGDSLIDAVGVGGSNGILYENLDIHPGTSGSTEQQFAILDLGGTSPALGIGQTLSLSTDMRIENATSFVDDNPFERFSRVTTLTFFSSAAATGPLPAQVILQRGQNIQGQAPDMQDYVFGILADGFSQQATVSGDVADLGLVNNSPNEISDFFNVEMVIQRNAINDFDVIGMLDDENGLNLQTVSATGLDFSDIFDESTGTTWWSIDVDNTAYIAHENLIFDNFRLSVSVPEPSSFMFFSAFAAIGCLIRRRDA